MRGFRAYILTRADTYPPVDIQAADEALQKNGRSSSWMDTR